MINLPFIQSPSCPLIMDIAAGELRARRNLETTTVLLEQTLSGDVAGTARLSVESTGMHDRQYSTAAYHLMTDALIEN